MIVVTTETIHGYEMEKVIGHVFGVVVTSRRTSGNRNIAALFRSLSGGEIKEYTELLADARKAAIDRLIQNAHVMGANAVVRMCFDSSEIGLTMAEIVAYGTAVVVREL